MGGSAELSLSAGRSWLDCRRALHPLHTCMFRGPKLEAIMCGMDGKLVSSHERYDYALYYDPV